MTLVGMQFRNLVDCFQNNIEKSRWAFLLVFVIGYAITFTKFPDESTEFLIFNLIAFFSCVVLLTQLNRYQSDYTAIWLVFILFIAIYFIRFYWIAIDSTAIQVMIPKRVYIRIMEDKTLIDGFKISVIAFSVFSAASATLLYFQQIKNKPESLNISESAAFQWLIAKALFIVVPVLMLIFAIITHKYRIGEMGAESGEPLPFRLKGVIFYARFILIPLMILLIIYLAGRHGHIIAARLGIFLFLTHGVVEMLLRGSRSSILLIVLLLLFMVMAGGLKVYRKEKFLAFFVLILGLFMVPVMTEYRMNRLVEELPIMESIFTAIYHVGINGWSTLLHGIEFVFFRMPGLEAVSAIEAMTKAMALEPLGIQTFEILKSKQGVAGYLTNVLYFIPVEAATLSAPSYIGWFYIVGGVPAVIAGSTLLSIFVVVGWRLLNTNYLVCRPVILTFFLWVLFIAFTDGVLDSMTFMFVVGLIVLVVFEISMKLGARSYYGYLKKNAETSM